MMYLPRNMKITCNHRGLTHYGGIFFFQEFIRVLQFRRFLTRQLGDFRPHHDYSFSQIILALIYPIILGLNRLKNACLLRSLGCHLPVSYRPARVSRSANPAPVLVAGSTGISPTTPPIQ